MAKAKDKAEEQAQAQAEAKRQTMAEKQKKAEAKAAQTGYKKLLDDVLALKEMTDTPKWRALYASARKSRRDHHNAMLTTDNGTKDMLRHKEAAVFIDEFLGRVGQPCEELAKFCNEMTLFAAQFKTRAEWNAELGIVRIYSQ